MTDTRMYLDVYPLMRARTSVSVYSLYILRRVMARIVVRTTVYDSVLRERSNRVTNTSKTAVYESQN